jgi:hypothetical protein
MLADCVRNCTFVCFFFFFFFFFFQAISSAFSDEKGIKGERERKREREIERERGIIPSRCKNLLFRVTKSDRPVLVTPD